MENIIKSGNITIEYSTKAQDYVLFLNVNRHMGLILEEGDILIHKGTEYPIVTDSGLGIAGPKGLTIDEVIGIIGNRLEVTLIRKMED